MFFESGEVKSSIFPSKTQQNRRFSPIGTSDKPESQNSQIYAFCFIFSQIPEFQLFPEFSSVKRQIQPDPRSSQIPESQISDPRSSQIPDPARSQNLRSQIPNLRSQISDPKSQVSGLRSQNSQIPPNLRSSAEIRVQWRPYINVKN